MQKKRLSTKVFSVVLSLLMILTVIPLVPAITADAAYAKEYYYPAGTKFIKDIAMVYYQDSGEGQTAIKNAVGHDAGRGYALIQDLTAGTGGDYYVYIGWTWTTNPAEAVRGFRLDHNGSMPAYWQQSGVYWYPVNTGSHAWVPQLHGDGCVDTNRGAGGDDIKVYITKDPNFGPPLTNLYRAGSTSERDSRINSGWTGVVSFQDNSYIVDLNKGAGGDDLFFVYTHNSTPVSTSALRSTISKAETYATSENYTIASRNSLNTYINNGKTIINAFDSEANHGYTTYNQTAINNAANNINSALNNLQTYVYLNASSNGGASDQTVAVTIGTKSQAPFDFSKYSASKANSDFLGWADSPRAKEGISSTINVGFNETYYALYGTKLTATFHYLLADGTIKTDKREVNALNAATAGMTPIPSLEDVTIDGKTYTALGWREDTLPAEKTVNKTGIYTIYTSNPTVDIYAVYTAPLTFTQDVNKGEPAVEPQTATQYINVNSELTKTSHEFTVSEDTPVRDGGTFIGWADTTTATQSMYDAGYKFTLTDDLTIYAAYKMNFVDVTFVDGNGNEISTQTVPYGDDAVAPAVTPEKDFDGEAHYVFTGWDTDFTAAKTDLTVNAVFDEIAHTIEDDIATEPTCTEKGVKDQYCTGCDYRIKDIEIDALGHNKAFDPGTPATCTTDGSTDYITCLRCLEVLQEREVLPALGHDYILDTAKPATCSVGGYEIWVCKNNNNHKETRNETMPTGEHIAKVVKGYEATCLENGLTEGTECEQCGAVLVPQNIILADGHDLIIDKFVAPTCEDTGLTEGAHCEDCDYKVAQEVIPALGHDWADFTAEAATCTKPGFTAGSKCRFCHEVRDSIEIPALNHSWEIIEHPADCTTDGYTEYICAYNDAHNYTVAGEKASGHTGGTATCSEQAVCDICKEPYGKTTDHNYEAVVFEATCTKGGYTEYTCTACGDSYKGDETAVADHTYDEGKVTIEATCENEGVKTFTCLYCDAFYTETIPAKGHSVDNWVVNGTEAEGDCSDCGEHITADPEDVGLELPECERCGMVHRYNSGIFKYKGIYCSIVYFFRQIANFFKGNA